LWRASQAGWTRCGVFGDALITQVNHGQAELKHTETPGVGGGASMLLSVAGAGAGPGALVEHALLPVGTRPPFNVHQLHFTRRVPLHLMSGPPVATWGWGCARSARCGTSSRRPATTGCRSPCRGSRPCLLLLPPPPPPPRRTAAAPPSREPTQFLSLSLSLSLHRGRGSAHLQQPRPPVSQPSSSLSLSLSAGGEAAHTCSTADRSGDKPRPPPPPPPPPPLLFFPPPPPPLRRLGEDLWRCCLWRCAQ
jgi:hypothetical protein